MVLPGSQPEPQPPAQESPGAALAFATHHRAAKLSADGTVATGPGIGTRSAAAGAEMAAGVHCAHFTLRKADGLGQLSSVGVVGAGFNAAEGPAPPALKPQRAGGSAEGWMLDPDGHLHHDGKDSEWEGRAAAKQLKEGDVVGLVLDVGAGTLAVYANGRRLGTVVQPGMTNTEGEPVAPLRPPLRWAVAVGGGHRRPGEVAIDGPAPLVGGQPAFLRGGSAHDDKAMPVGTVLEVEGRRGTYQAFKKNWVGANEHTILLDDGTTLTGVKLKEREWRFPDIALPASGKWPGD